MADWTCAKCGRGNRDRDRQCGLCRTQKPGAGAEPKMQKLPGGRAVREQKGAKR